MSPDDQSFTIRTLTVQILAKPCRPPTPGCGPLSGIPKDWGECIARASGFACGDPSVVLWINPADEAFRLEPFREELRTLLDKYRLKGEIAEQA